MTAQIEYILQRPVCGEGEGMPKPSQISPELCQISTETRKIK
ncbi:hypothetical protein SPSIL_050050 [Sporomusa silvacetica DSM 10669]|uniref:Uncharacterized protein n=1 Tax=Sporomusa silvacetica DSM 10669 TaxID=1123289 RepID=A0ABZ3ISW2_9FIRM|nr:hypothetical protein SPSIL_06790 [Sporomusa silvacetica DSM 10669]